MQKERKLEDGSGEIVEHHEHGDIRGDERNIVILFFLYLLQGIPLGLSAAIPMLLQNRNVSYRQQVRFCIFKMVSFILLGFTFLFSFL